MDFIITRTNGETYNLVSLEYASAVTSAKLKQTLMQEDIVNIDVYSAKPINVQIGDTLNVFGSTYTVNQLPTSRRIGAHSYQTTIALEGRQYELIDKLFFPPEEDGIRGESLCLDLAHMAELVVANANRGRQGQKPFIIAECPEDTEYHNMTFSGVNCLKALQDICQQWEVEFVLKETTQAIEIHLAQNVGQVDTSYTYQYGKGAGIYSIQRAKATEDVITRLYVYGGKDNLTYYRHTKLCLPGKTRWESYIEDAAQIQRYGLREAIKDFDDIYPTFTGRVKATSSYKTFTFEEQYYDAAAGEYKWRPCSFDLNKKWQKEDYPEWLALRGIADTTENKRIFEEDTAGKATRYLVAGTTAVVHFQTGALAGYDIDIEKANSSNVSNTAITLSPLVDENNYEFPSRDNKAFQIKPGDEFIFLGINLPDEWKQTAEQKLKDEAQKYYDDNCKVQAKYTLQIEPTWLKRNREYAGETNVFVVGNSIQILDIEGGLTDVTAVRINSMERDLLNVYDYKLTLSDSVEIKSTSRVVSAVAQIEQTLQMNDLTDPNTRRRSWNIKQEVLDQVFDTDGYFTDKIRPLSIETSMLAVGAKSQQFSIANMVMQANVPYLDNTPQPDVVRWTAGILNHYAIIEDGVRAWNIAEGSVSSLPPTPLYIYARCEKDEESTNATIVIDSEARQYGSDATYYYFLIGNLSSVDEEDNTRVITLTNGFTTINGKYIKTGRIESTDGKTFVDLDEGKIGGNIVFESTEGEQQIDEFVNKLVGDGVKEATKDLKIKGDNLYRNTGDFSGDKLWIRRINGAIDSGEDTFKPTIEGETYNNNKVSSMREAWRGFGQDFECEPNTKYTMSCYVRSDTNMSCYAFYNDNGRTSYTNSSIMYFGEEWQRIVFTFTTTSTATKARVMLECTTSDKWYCSSIKVEKGDTATDWIANPNDITDKIKMQEYLQQAIQDTTEVRGGLLLTQMIGVGSGDNTTAGMNGSGSGDDTIRFWAGSTSFGDAPDAPFRVFDNGRVVMSKAQIESTSGTNKLSLADGSILLYDGDNPLTQIIPIKAGTIDDAIKLFNQGSIVTTSSPQATATISAVNNIATWNETKWEEYIDKDVRVGSGQKIYDVFTATGSGIMTISTNPTLTCTKQVTYPIERIGNDPAGSPFYYMTNQKNTTHTYVVQLLIGGIVVKTFNSVGTISLTGAYNVAQGQKVQIRISYTSTSTLSVRCNHNNNVQAYGWGNSADSTEGILTLSSFKYSVSFAKYNSKYLADGFILSNATDNYMAYIPTAGKTRESFRLRQGNTILRMIGEQLTINYNGSTASLYNLNPLVMIVEFTWNRSTTKFSTSIKYNPLGKSVTISNPEATGKYLITHNIGDSNISFSTQYCWGGTGNTYSRTPMIQHVSDTQCRLFLNIGNSLYNPQNNGDYVVLYCYKFS